MLSLDPGSVAVPGSGGPLYGLRCGFVSRLPFFVKGADVFSGNPST